MVTERKETKQMQSTFEKLGGTYKQVGDYLLPDVAVPENLGGQLLGHAAEEVSVGTPACLIYGTVPGRQAG